MGLKQRCQEQTPWMVDVVLSEHRSQEQNPGWAAPMKLDEGDAGEPEIEESWLESWMGSVVEIGRWTTRDSSE